MMWPSAPAGLDTDAREPTVALSQGVMAALGAREAKSASSLTGPRADAGISCDDSFDVPEVVPVQAAELGASSDASPGA